MYLISKISKILLILLLISMSNNLVFGLDCDNLRYLIEKRVIPEHYSALKVDKTLIRRSFLDFLDTLDSDRIYFFREDIESWLTYISRIEDKNLIRDTCSLIEKIAKIYPKRSEGIKEVVRSILNKVNTLDDIITVDAKQKIETDPSKVDFFYRKDLIESRLKPILRYDLVVNIDRGNSFEEALKNTILSYYYHFKRVKTDLIGSYYDKFFNSLLRRFDPHSFYDPIFNNDSDTNESSYVGFGFELKVERGNHYIITKILDDAVDELKENVKKGDEIILITDPKGKEVYTVGREFSEVDELIKGKEGTSSKIVFYRYEGFGTAGRDKYIPLNLTRRKINLVEDSVASRIETIKSDYTGKDYRIGVLTLKSFLINQNQDSKTLSSEVYEHLQFLDKRVHSLVIDLRGNLGGNVDEAIKILNFFFDSPVSMGTVKRHENTDTEDINEKYIESELINKVFLKPLVVLIDKASASASEAFAGAIQDLGRGVVIGGQSFGKATMQNVGRVDQIATLMTAIHYESHRRTYTLDYKLAYLGLTIGRLYRPSGTCIQNVGVTPDIVIPFTNDLLQIKTESQKKGSFREDRIEPQEYVRYSHIENFVPFLKQRMSKRIQNSNIAKNLQISINQFNEDTKEELSTLKSLNPAPKRTFDKESERQYLMDMIKKITFSEAMYISSDLIDITEGNIPPSL